MALASRIGVRVFTLSSNEPVLIKLEDIGDTNKFMLLFKESIVRIFTQQWRKDIESSSKLRIYALLKKIFLC